jgi:hypothetical protein
MAAPHPAMMRRGRAVATAYVMIDTHPPNVVNEAGRKMALVID